MTVFLGIPTYDEWVHTNTMMGVIHASKKHHLQMQVIGSSVTPFAFNQLWCTGVLSGAEYFAMCHADVGPDAYWIDTLIEELENTNADIMAAMIPIKDAARVYSVAMCHDNEPAHYRLTVEHAKNLPDTFFTEDMHRVTGEDGLLCANTGLWVCRLDRPWTRQVDFAFDTSIDWSREKPRCHLIPEDWRLSQILHRGGYKVACTKKVKCTDAGQHTWVSYG
jgi:hypothetical protein